MSLDLRSDVANEPPGGSCLNAMFDEKFRILIFVDLLEVETIFKSHIAGFLDVYPECLTADP